MHWFMEQIKRGEFEVINPFSHRTSRIAASADAVHSIVFWSKNFAPFLDGNHGEKLLEMGYHLYFSFSVNSHAPYLEPRVPPLEEKLRQLKTLSSRFDPRWIDWRFDPICFYKTGNSTIKNNLHDFKRIAEAAAAAGIERCITSFMDHYRKIKRRIQSMVGFSFVDPVLEEKIDILLNMNETLKKLGIQLLLCCEKELLEALPTGTGIGKSSCIPNHRLKQLFGGDIALEKDRGQRVKAGCGCGVSVDIGSYHFHPCPHGCIFCYANPLLDENNPRSS